MRREKRKETHLTLIERNVSEAVDFLLFIKSQWKKWGWKKSLYARKENRFCIKFPFAAVIIIISRGFIDFPPGIIKHYYYHQMPSLITGDVDEYSLSFSSSISMLNLPSSSSSVCRLLIFLFFFLAEHFSFNLAVVIDLIDSAEALRCGAFAVMITLLVFKKSDTYDDDAVDFNLINCSRGVIECWSCTDMAFFNASISFHTWHLIWPNSQPICFDSDACVFC